MTTRYLTAAWLDKQGACEDMAALAILHFGRRVALTRAFLLEAAGLGLPLKWLAFRLLPLPLQPEYARQLASLWEEYARQGAPLWEEYDRQRASLWEEYDRQGAPLREEYARQRALLLAELLDL